MDAVVCATAFHWFSIAEARREFSRIVKPCGAVALLWNIRKPSAYEDLIVEFATDYQARWDHGSGTLVEEFFAGSASRYSKASVPNVQLLDWGGFVGRVLSASYMPLPGDPRHEPLLRRLRELFDSSQRDGSIRFEYNTMIYRGGESS